MHNLHHHTQRRQHIAASRFHKLQVKQNPSSSERRTRDRGRRPTQTRTTEGVKLVARTDHVARKIKHAHKHAAACRVCTVRRLGRMTDELESQEGGRLLLREGAAYLPRTGTPAGLEEERPFAHSPRILGVGERRGHRARPARRRRAVKRATGEGAESPADQCLSKPFDPHCTHRGSRVDGSSYQASNYSISILPGPRRRPSPEERRQNRGRGRDAGDGDGERARHGGFAARSIIRPSH